MGIFSLIRLTLEPRDFLLPRTAKCGHFDRTYFYELNDFWFNLLSNIVNPRQDQTQLVCFWCIIHKFWCILTWLLGVSNSLIFCLLRSIQCGHFDHNSWYRLFTVFIQNLFKYAYSWSRSNWIGMFSMQKSWITCILSLISSFIVFWKVRSIWPHLVVLGISFPSLLFDCFIK